MGHGTYGKLDAYQEHRRDVMVMRKQPIRNPRYSGVAVDEATNVVTYRYRWRDTPRRSRKHGEVQG